MIAENDVEPPGARVQPAQLENLRVPTELPRCAAYFNVRQVGTTGDSGVVGPQDVEEYRGLGGSERQRHGDCVEEDSEVDDALANGIL